MFRTTFKNLTEKPGLTIGTAFSIFIMIGTILLMLPVATADGEGTSLVDAIFTSTSAICVTGLIVQDTLVYFSRFGHVVILIMMQLGGLGIMTSYAFFSIAIGKRLLISQQVAMKGVLDTEYGEIKKTVLFIVISTFIIEAIGAVVLAIHWSNEPFGDYVFYSIFHSISAFCNAGFSLFSNSLINYSGDVVTNITIGLLIVSGGLGFIVLSNLFGYFSFFSKKNKKRRINLHTKIVLTMTGILIILGAILFYTFECKNTLDLFSIKDKVFVSFFQSITTRTAGFATVDISSLAMPTFLYFVFFMFIGGSSGSTAGGIKVSTFFVIIAVVYNMLRGRGDVELFERTIHRRTVQKAVSISIISLLTILIFCLILLYTENAPFRVVIFEAFSAFGTVGLSAGLTPDLTTSGKIIVSMLIFIGRIGPLALALILGREVAERKIRFPEERIVVG
ncbi:MAG: potassium uptake system protein TrkH [Candidatus Scalindua rubra]|uniref:Potassium uptake system protein TrkH n=1 Tax=Candidatus Scalindua rubra TaxID=1872076 RepID=A0A1E3X6X3_9BACT|nr:MAG: potassium uptake system protein TrkH [Candidatus Scalindua rubra]